MNVPAKLLHRSGALTLPAFLGVPALVAATCAGFSMLGGWAGLTGIVLIEAIAVAGLLRWPA